MADVFISYARVNNTDGFINRLAEMLKGLGKDVWVDWEDIPHGVDYVEEFTKGVDEANTIITVLTPDYLGRPNCLRELNRAVEHSKRIIPVIRLDIDFAQVPEQIRNINAIFIRETDNFEQAFKILIKTIDTDIDYVRNHTRLLNLAQEWEKENRDSSVLLRGTELQQAEAWLATSAGKIPQPDELHTEFILASRQSAIARQRIILAGVSVALVVSIALSILSLLLYRQAETQRAIAITAQGEALIQAATAERRAVESQSLALAGNAQAAVEINQIQAVALGIAAGSIERPPALAERILSDVAYAPGVMRAFDDHQEIPTALAFSPDGQTALSGGEAGELILWDVNTGQAVRKYSGFEGEISDLVFISDGKSFIASSLFGEIKLFDVETGETIHSYEDENYSITELALSDDGRTMLSADCWEVNEDGAECVTGIITRWDMTSDEAIEWYEVDGEITGMDFSSDGKLAVVVSSEGTITLIDMVNDEILDTYEDAHDGFAIMDVAFSPDGSTFTTAGADQYAIVWEWDGEDIVDVEYLYGHKDYVTDIDYSPDGKTILTASDDSSILVWDFENVVILQRFTGHSGRILRAAFSPDGQSILSAGLDNLILLHDLHQGDILNQLDTNDSIVTSVDFSPDGETAVTSHLRGEQDTDLELLLWDVNTGELIRQFQSASNFSDSVHFSLDGKFLLTTQFQSGTTILWDAASGQPVRFFENPDAWVINAAFSPDGQTIASANNDGTVILWNVNSDTSLRTFQQHHEAANEVVFSLDGKYIVSGSNDATLVLADAATGEGLRTFEGHLGGISALGISPDGRTLLSGSSDNTLMLWEIETGTALRTFTGHTGQIDNVEFSPDGRTAISGSFDNRVILWDIGTGEILHVFIGHEDWVSAVAFSPDGSKIISGSADRQAFVWRVDPLDQLLDWTYQNRYVRELDCQERLTYNVQPACDETGVYPTRTPFATWTPMPTATVTPAP